MAPMEHKFALLSVCLAILAVSAVVRADKADSRKADERPDGQISWYDCKNLGVEGKGWTDTPAYYDRLPRKAQAKAPPGVWELSHCSAGMCVRFRTDAPTIQVRWRLLKPPSGVRMTSHRISFNWKPGGSIAPFSSRR